MKLCLLAITWNFASILAYTPPFIVRVDYEKALLEVLSLVDGWPQDYLQQLEILVHPESHRYYPSTSSGTSSYSYECPASSNISGLEIGQNLSDVPEILALVAPKTIPEQAVTLMASCSVGQKEIIGPTQLTHGLRVNTDVQPKASGATPKRGGTNVNNILGPGANRAHGKGGQIPLKNVPIPSLAPTVLRPSDLSRLKGPHENKPFFNRVVVIPSDLNIYALPYNEARICVYNLNPKTTHATLYGIFSRLGTILDLWIVSDGTAYHSNFAFIEYADGYQSVEAALNFNKRLIGGRSIGVIQAEGHLDRTGRKLQLFIRARDKLEPAEAKAFFLCTHPALASLELLDSQFSQYKKKDFKGHLLFSSLEDAEMAYDFLFGMGFRFRRIIF